MAVTNVQIKWNSLRQEDGERFLRVNIRLYETGEEITRIRRMAQERYREKRCRRMQVQVRGTAQSDDESIL